eukprot:SAG22_NODE_416_length_10804_cov_4.791126_4_plen_1245_part_00
MKLHKLASELAGMKPSALRKHALDVGVDAALVEEAEDSSDPRQSMTGLIIAKMQDPRTSNPDAARPAASSSPVLPGRAVRPHFGDRKPAAASNITVNAESASVVSIPHLHHHGSTQCTVQHKHAMLSYQWGCQDLVIKAKAAFQRRGFPCWIDIEGGMDTDLYDSMAVGVANAACVVAFIDSRYQVSENCQLELKYGRTQKVPIVPVMMEKNWEATGWLGIVTAGILWTPLYDDDTFAANIGALCDHVAKYVMPTAHATAPVLRKADVQIDVDRLREDLRGETKEAADTSAGVQELAMLPAEVPILPSSFRKLPAMVSLKEKLMDPASDGRIGFFGLGGAGKTVTSAWIARGKDIRRHFDHILWVSFGQQPNPLKLTALVYQQLTGRVLGPDETEESRRQTLMEAMRGKRLLLILDDLWEPKWERLLNFVDVEAGARCLISTRVKSLLTEKDSVQVQLPTEAEAAALLMVAAGCTGHAGSDVPPEVFQAVKLCGRLPLALEMAGRLIQGFGLDLGVSRNWKGIPEQIREQLQGGSSSGGRDGGGGAVEDRLIMASIESMDGVSAAEKAQLKNLLYLFAVVPEDTYLIPEAMAIMYNAIFSAEGKPVPPLKLRMLTQTLINRSLVLGQCERPQVHDIVRDYCIGRFEPEELRVAQEHVVVAFAECRPSQIYGWSRLDDHPLAVYICNEVGEHVAQAFQPTGWQNNKAFMGWVDSTVTDVISVAAWQCLGSGRLEALAEEAMQDNRPVVACVRYHAACAQHWAHTGHDVRAQIVQLAPRLAAAVDSVLNMGDSHDPSHPSLRVRECLALQVLNHIMTTKEVDLITDIYRPRAEALQSDALFEDSAWSGFFVMFTRNNPISATLTMEPEEWVQCQQAVKTAVTTLRMLQRSATDRVKRRELTIVFVAYSMMSWDTLAQLPDFDPECVTTSDVENAIRLYDYELSHAPFMSNTMGDPYIHSPIALMPTIHSGDLYIWDTAIDFQLKQIIRSTQDIGCHWEVQNHFYFSAIFGLGVWGVLLKKPGFVRQCLQALGFSWDTVESKMEAAPPAAKGSWRPAGDTSTKQLVTQDGVIMTTKMLCVLACTDDMLPPANDFFALLPSPLEIAKLAATRQFSMFALGMMFGNPALYAALACERYGERGREKALGFCGQVMVQDTAQFGGRAPAARIVAGLVRGRVLAAMGQETAARKAFADAAGATKRARHVLLEAMVYHERHRCLPELDGDAQQRETALQVLNSPADRLQKFFD